TPSSPPYRPASQASAGPASPPTKFERTLRHGHRRAAEMHECAATPDSLGLGGALATAIAAVEDRMGALTAPAPAAEDLAAAVAGILQARLVQAAATPPERGARQPPR
ncbi:MAG TPA: DUF1932 domain-containing protein, partial [Paracoccaceae bacterium]|nr:DUF1932 domain-containing protein [Paracoccaceae bacterium]